MVRSAILTLGVALTIGGVSAVQADDLILPDVTSLTAWAPSFYGVFSSFPENWSDLPFQLKVSESAAYNSNILNTPVSSGATSFLFGRPIGAFESISSYAASTKAYWGGQQFFADGSFGTTRYLGNDNFNFAQNSVDAGVNWTYGAKCTGKLIGAEATSQSLPGQQVGFNVINSVTTTEFNENATCIVTGEYKAIFNSGVSTSTNSAAVDSFNNFQSVFVAAGMSYSVPDTNSLQLLATITGTDYTNRPLTMTNFGLSPNITTDQVILTYTKNLSPNLALNASIGVLGVRYTSFSLDLPSGYEPDYSLSVTWTATPKLDLSASISRTVALPTSVIANLQITEAGSLDVTYRATPKVTLAAGVRAEYSTGGFIELTSPAVSAANQIATQSADFYGLHASLAYAITPFLAANLSYQYNKSVYTNLVTPTSVVLLSLNFNPY